MKSKKIFCLFLCLSILLSITACSNAEDPLSSNSSIPSNSTTTSTNDTSSDEDYKDVEIIESEDASGNNSSNNQQTSSTTSNNSSVSSNITSSDNDSSSADLMEMLYGFSSIKSVNYYCLRNLSGSDILYSVSSIITNKNTDIASDTSVTISCDGAGTERGCSRTVPVRWGVGSASTAHRASGTGRRPLPECRSKGSAFSQGSWLLPEIPDRWPT